MLETQKALPIPKVARGPQRKPRPRRYPFDTMEIDDMFFVENRNRNNLKSYASEQGRALGRRFKTRFLFARKDATGKWIFCASSDKGAVPGIMIWRIS